MTDQFRPYRGIGPEFDGGHHTVNHSFARRENGKMITTNDAEAYFALLKRGVTGSFHHVSKKHLHRYCNEFSYRWNERKTSDGERTFKAI